MSHHNINPNASVRVIATEAQTLTTPSPKKCGKKAPARPTKSKQPKQPKKFRQSRIFKIAGSFPTPAVMIEKMYSDYEFPNHPCSKKFNVGKICDLPWYPHTKEDKATFGRSFYDELARRHPVYETLGVRFFVSEKDGDCIIEMSVWPSGGSSESSSEARKSAKKEAVKAVKAAKAAKEEVKRKLVFDYENFPSLSSVAVDQVKVAVDQVEVVVDQVEVAVDQVEQVAQLNPAPNLVESISSVEPVIVIDDVAVVGENAGETAEERRAKTERNRAFRAEAKARKAAEKAATEAAKATTEP